MDLRGEFRTFNNIRKEWRRLEDRLLISIWIHNYELARVLSELGSRLAGVEFLTRLKSVLNFLSVGMGSSLNRCSASCPYSYCDGSCCDFFDWLLHYS